MVQNQLTYSRDKKEPITDPFFQSEIKEPPLDKR